MKWFRNVLAKNRVFVLTVLMVSLYPMAGGPEFAHAYQVHQQEEERLKEISEILDIPVEDLRPDHLTLMETLGKAFGVESEDPVKKAGRERLEKVLREHEKQLASNPYLPQIEAVKQEHAIYRIEGTLQDILELTDPPGRKALRPQAKRAMMRNLDVALQERLELPPLPEGLPAQAHERQAEMQRVLDRIAVAVQPILKEAMAEKSEGVNPEKIVRMKQAVDGLLARTKREPRFVDQPLPLRRVERKARTLDLDEASAAAPKSAFAGAESTPKVPSKAGIAPELQALAGELGNSPAKIFRYIHDNIDYDAKWGAFKSPLGTYWEESGTSWEQAWLLRDLLVAAGVDARFEWGEVEIGVDMLTNITGVQDPWRAGDLLTTAGVPIVLLTEGSRVVKARMSHVWVKAWVDYVPNRGLTPGPGDTWIRMDPSLKRFEYAPGIRIHEQVPFSLGDYLLSGTTQSPRRAFEDSLWSYIRANDIDCVTLEQLKPKGTVIAENFPYVPGTLRAKILGVDGESSGIPAGMQEKLTVEVRETSGSSLLSWNVLEPATFGQRLEVAWRGATADDQATLDSYGGVFETPPYLVELVPVVRLGGVDQVVGSAVGSAEDVEVVVTTTAPSGVGDVFVHQGHAGEPSVVVTAFGKVPQQLTNQFQVELNHATEAEDDAEIEMATLQLLGTTYFQNLGRDAEDIAGWNWHRLLRLVSEGLVVQTGTVTTSADGSPLTFERAERFVDFPGFVVGLFHATGQDGISRPTMELAGAQGSFLEGQVFEQSLREEGVAAVSALTRARREGQAVRSVDATNVDAVFAETNLSEEIENQVRRAVSQGQLAWIPEAPVTLNRWQGTGFVLADPSTGAAAYLLTGGFAGGAATGSIADFVGVLGTEDWLEGNPFAEILQLLQQDVPEGGDGDDTNGPGTNQSDPVNMATGNFWRSEVDFSILARGMGLVWRRTYNSHSQRRGLFGNGWTFSLGESLEEQPNGDVLYIEEDGSEHLFKLVDGGFEPPPGKSLLLSNIGASFELSTKEGISSNFSLSGKLLSISDTNGNSITLDYDKTGTLSAVHGPAGRKLVEVKVLNGKLRQLTDLSGRTMSYEYQLENLVAATDFSGKTWTYQYDSANRLIARSDPFGNTHSYSYDTQGRCIRHSDPSGGVESFHYKDQGRSATLSSPRGHVTYFEFDERGRGVLSVDPLGNPIRSTWDANNNRLTTENARGGKFIRSFDSKGNLLSETNPLGETTRFSYEPRLNRLTKIVDSEGAAEVFNYDENGNMLTRSMEVDGVQVEVAHSYNEFGQLVESRGPSGETSLITWDPVNGNIAKATDALGQTTKFETDLLGRVVSVIDPVGAATKMKWNSRDRVVEILDVFDNRISIDYDKAGRPYRLAGSNRDVSIEYDPAGRPVTIATLRGLYRFVYDAGGNQVATVDPLGNRRVRMYDAVGRLLLERDPLGAISSVGYCADVGRYSGSFCHMTDGEGKHINQKLDSLGRVSRIVDPLVGAIETQYDSLGRKAAVKDALNRTTRYGYDSMDQVTALIEANGARTEYGYDLRGNLTLMKDAEGRVWSRKFNSMNRLIASTDPLGNTTRYTYDPLGNLKVKETPNGEVIQYEYDHERLTQIRSQDGDTESFGYDGAGRLISMSNSDTKLSFVYDRNNQLVRKTDHILAQTIEYRYDAVGNVISTTGPKGEIRYKYDAAGRMVQQDDPATGGYRLEYDNVGRIIEEGFPNGWTNKYIYDPRRGHLDSVIMFDVQAEIRNAIRYTYDEVGNRVTMTNAMNGNSHQYTYDDVNRLRRWDRGVGVFEEYSYDAVGNRLKLRDQTGETSYQYDSANSLLKEVRVSNGGSMKVTNRSWDLNGNLVSIEESNGNVVTFEYDARNRMTRLNGPEGSLGFGYAPDGTRVRVTSSTSTSRLLSSQEDIIAVYDGSGQIETYYSHGPGIDVPFAQVDGNGVNYLHRDGLGSISALTSSDGQLVGARSYGPFGDLRSSSGIYSGYAFSGRELDSSGLMYYRARYYEPEVGRFTTRDFFDGFVSRPTSRHKYTYVENDPVNKVDPTGHVGIQAAGLVFMGTALLQGLSFFLFMLPETLGLIDSEVSGNPVRFFWGRLAATIFLEIIVLSVAGIYADIGWRLFNSGPGSTARVRALGKLRGMDLVKGAWREIRFTFGIGNLIKNMLPNEFWSLAIAAGCISVLKPLAISFEWSNINGGAFAVSLTLCWLGVRGVASARRALRP